MKKILQHKLLTLFCLSLMATFTNAQTPNLSWTDSVGAKIIPTATNIYSVLDFGAKNDGTTLNSRFIQAAIDTCANRGGGIVTFPAGSYLTGSIYVKKGVRLNIPSGVTILGSQNIADYPEIYTRIAGTEMNWPSAIINVLNQDDVMITGGGTINGQGKVYWDNYAVMRVDYEARGLRWVVDQDCKRPRSLLVSNSSNVTIKGLNFQQSGFWTLHLLYSSNCTVDGVIVRNNIGGTGPSTDGIDVDSSTKILIQNCDIDCNDDAYCLKSGRDADGLRINKPTEYVVIRKSTTRKGAAMFTLGSETSGWIRNVLVDSLTGIGTTRGFLMKSTMTRGGGAENIYIRNITMSSITGAAVEANVNWNTSYSTAILPAAYVGQVLPDYWYKLLEVVTPASLGIPTFRNIQLNNFNVTGAATLMSVAGADSSIIANVTLNNVTASVTSGGTVAYAKDWTVQNLTVTSSNPIVVTTNCDNVRFPNKNTKNQNALYETDFLSLPNGFTSGDLWGAGVAADAGKEKTMNGITFGAGPYGQRVNFNNVQEANAFGSGAAKYIAQTVDDNGATAGAFSFIKTAGGDGGGYMILPAVQGPFKMTLWCAAGNAYDKKYDLYYGNTFAETVTIPGGKFIKKKIASYTGTDKVAVKLVMSNQVVAANQNLYFYHLLLEDATLSAVSNVSAESDKKIIKTEYYDLTGSKKTVYTKGLVIKRTIFDDGSVSSQKMYIK